MKKTKKQPTKTSLCRKADSLFSSYWRQKIGRCEKCGNTQTLQLCHIITRGIRKLRFDRDNTVIMCASCHRHSHNKPLEFAEFVKEIKGEEIYKYLIKTSNILVPISRDFYIKIIADLKEKTEELEKTF